MNYLIFSIWYSPYDMVNIIWTILYGSYKTVQIVRSIRNCTYHMYHRIWTISYHMVHTISCIWYGSWFKSYRRKHHQSHTLWIRSRIRESFLYDISFIRDTYPLFIRKLRTVHNLWTISYRKLTNFIMRELFQSLNNYHHLINWQQLCIEPKRKASFKETILQ